MDHFSIIFLAPFSLAIYIAPSRSETGRKVFPKRDDYGSGYFKGLLSEHLVYDEKKKQPWQWKKIPGHERNESLDLRNYATAALKVLPADMDAIERRLMEARKKTPAAPTATPATPRATKRPAQRKGSALDRFYDEW